MAAKIAQKGDANVFIICLGRSVLCPSSPIVRAQTRLARAREQDPSML